MALILRPAKLRTEVEQAIRENKNVRYRNICYDVYYVNRSLVAKIGPTKEYNENEYKIGNYLFKNKIHVPKMHSLIKLNRFLCRNFHSNLVLLMQRIPGENITNLNGSKYEKARQLLGEELKKVSKLDLITMDTGTHNAIFNPHDGNVYLIDFEFWSRWSDSI